MEVLQWWDGHHTTNDKQYLTGTTLAQYTEIFEVSELVEKGKRFLEIGVGKGFAIRDLVALGKEVEALDISQVALDKVSKIAKTHITPTTLPSNSFDVIIMHLVAQHVNTATLTKLLKHAIRSLNYGGVLLLQTADVVDYKDRPQTDKYQCEGGVLYSDEVLRNIVKGCKGRVARKLDGKIYDTVTWHLYHIGKA